MFRRLNFLWFHQINQMAGQYPLPDKAMVWLASYGIFAVPAYLVCLWFVKSQNSANKVQALHLFTSAMASWGLAAIVSSLYYHPRPFALHLGRALIQHAADSSFPSDHTTVLSAIGFGLLYFRDLVSGFLFLGLALLVGYARVFCGIHFPLDILGGGLFGFAGSAIIALFKNRLNPVFTGIIRAFTPR